MRYIWGAHTLAGGIGTCANGRAREGRGWGIQHWLCLWAGGVCRVVGGCRWGVLNNREPGWLGCGASGELAHSDGRHLHMSILAPRSSRGGVTSRPGYARPTFVLSERCLPVRWVGVGTTYSSAGGLCGLGAALLPPPAWGRGKLGSAAQSGGLLPITLMLLQFYYVISHYRHPGRAPITAARLQRAIRARLIAITQKMNYKTNYRAIGSSYICHQRCNKMPPPGKSRSAFDVVFWRVAWNETWPLRC